MTQGFRIGITVIACLLLGPRVGDIGAGHPAAQGLDARQPPSLLAGQSATLLPDGTWLLIGGRSASQPVATASIWDPARSNGACRWGRWKKSMATEPRTWARPVSVPPW